MEERIAISEMELERFIGKVVTKDCLAGRGYFTSSETYIVPLPKIKDFDDVCASEDDDDITCDEVKEYISEELDSYEPVCWFKAMPVEPEDVDDQEFYLVICVMTDHVAEGFKIREIKVNARRVLSSLCGGMIQFPSPVMDSEFFEMLMLPPETVREIELLVSGRYLKDGFTLVGKPMPENKEMFHPNPAYCIARNSGWRNVYWHVYIGVDDDDIIEDMELSTYEREVSMFQRPHHMPDDPVDAFDAVLFICDQYTDEEWARLKEL